MGAVLSHILKVYESWMPSYNRKLRRESSSPKEFKKKRDIMPMWKVMRAMLFSPVKDF